MSNLHVRGVPETVHAALKRRAAAERRSINEVVLEALAEYASTPSALEFSKRMREQQGDAAVPSLDAIVGAVRAERDAR